MKFTVADPSSFGKWVRTAAKAIAEKPETETTQLLPGFAELFDADDG